MLVLAIDTSSATGSVALVRRNPDGGCDVLGEESFASERSHNALVFAPLGRMLKLARNHGGLGRVVVGTGPGSYTGIRIGIAAAHGIATAIGVPWTGWNSLATLADLPRFHVIGSALRGEFFHAIVDDGSLGENPEIHPIEVLPDIMANLASPVFTVDANPLHRDLQVRAPVASRLVGLTAAQPTSSAPIEPYYLRAPYITTPKD